MKTLRLLVLMVMLMSAAGCATCRQQMNYSASDQDEPVKSQHPFWEWFFDQTARNLVGLAW